jgi:hypothetical protein
MEKAVMQGVLPRKPQNHQNTIYLADKGGREGKTEDGET